MEGTLKRLNEVNCELELIKESIPELYMIIVELWLQRENLVEQINIIQEEENGSD